MADAHHVIPNGNVLVRDGKIAALWSGPPPPDVSTDRARVVDAGRRGLIFPALIDVHNHPSYDVLPLWAPPSSNAQRAVGRPTGREPYDNRYGWNLTSPPEYLRLVRNAHDALNDASALDLGRDVLVHAETQAALGGESAPEGESTGVLIRAVEGTNFGRSRIDAWVPSIVNLQNAADLAQRMAAGALDAWSARTGRARSRDEQRAVPGRRARAAVRTPPRKDQPRADHAVAVVHRLRPLLLHHAQRTEDEGRTARRSGSAVPSLPREGQPGRSGRRPVRAEPLLPQVVPAFVRSSSSCRSSIRRILPVSVFGKSWTNSTRRGYA